jgi:hypothetical protein
MSQTLDRQTYGENGPVPLSPKTMAEALSMLTHPAPSQWQRINLLLRIDFGEWDT